MILRVFLLTVHIVFSLYVSSQSSSIPKSFFRSPVDIPLDLSANFGELRSNHWHMGLDIRTQQRVNLPVYAAAGGYIAHIGIRSQSFGRFIIIKHPNGLSTLYAHLNDFFPELEKYVTYQQYKQETWAIELDFDNNQFPVSKGSFIAYSGTTGGSQGPHLHFEIIDTKTEKRLNPLLFDFPLKDNVPPSIIKLAMYDRTKSVYDQTPLFFSLKKTGEVYVLAKEPFIKAGTDKLSFAIQANDKLSGSNNPNGIFSAKLCVDNEPQVSFVLDSIDYDDTHYLNAHIDYKYDYKGGAYLQHVSKLPGNQGSVYKMINGDGVINLTDSLQHEITIDVKDAYGNISQLKFLVQLDAKGSTDVTDYAVPHFAPIQENVLKKQDVEFYIGAKELYDSVPIQYYRKNTTIASAYSGIHQLNDAAYPIHDEMLVRIKPTKQIPAALKDKLVIQRTTKGNSFSKAEWQGEWLAAKFGSFGTFSVIADDTPPVLKDPGRGDTINLSAATRIVFTPTDNLGGIRSFKAELDGQWLRFTNDKSRSWIYIFDERCPDGVHELKVTVEDIVGNSTTKTWWFSKYPYTPPVKKKAPVKKKITSKKKQ